MTRLVCLCAIALVAIGAATVHADEVLYRECFGNDSLGLLNYRSPADYQWQACHGGFGLATPVYTGTEEPVPTYQQFVTNEAGRPQDLGNVNAGASFSQANGFYAFKAAYPAYTDRVILYTDEYAVNSLDWAVTAFSWQQGTDNDIDQPEARVAVRIAGAWYVSTQTFASDDMPEGQFGAHANVAHHTFAFTTAAAAWRPLLFTPGEALQLTLVESLDTDLPAGDITAFGLYLWQKGARYSAIDTFQIDAAPAVPEPGSLALLALGLAPLLRSARRRRSNR